MEMSKLIKRPNIALILSAVSAMGFFIIYVLTYKRGVGITADGPTYIHMARCLNSLDLCDKNHLILSVNEWQHFPPLFPFALATIHWLGGPDPILGARFLNAILFSVNIFMFGSLIYKNTKDAYLTSIGALWMLMKIDILSIHTAAMSEPLFITFMLSWALLFLDYFTTRRVVSLLGFSLAAALACMTRFAGIPLVLTGLLMLLLEKKKNEKNSFSPTFIFMIVSLSPLVLWMVKNYLEIGHFVAVDRGVSLHSFSFQGLHCSWPINHSNFTYIALVLIFILIYLGWRIWIKRTSAAEDASTSLMSFMHTIIIFIFIYIIFWGIVGMSVQYKATPGRYFLPLEIFGIILFFILVHLFLSMTEGYKSLKFCFVFFLLLYFVGINSLSAVPWFEYRYNIGMEYDGQDWDSSEIITEIQNIPSNMMIYTNNPWILYVRGNRRLLQIVGLSQKSNTLSTLRLYSDCYSIKRMTQDLYDKKGLIVYFYSMPDWYREDKDLPNIISLDELKKILPLKLLYKVSDGVIYGWNEQK